jgi:hypothetical protein
MDAQSVRMMVWMITHKTLNPLNKAFSSFPRKWAQKKSMTGKQILGLFSLYLTVPQLSF